MPCICLLAAAFLTQGRTGVSASASAPPWPQPPIAPEMRAPTWDKAPVVPRGMDLRTGAITVSEACGRGVDGGGIVRLDDGEGHLTRLNFGLDLAKSLGDPMRLIGIQASVIGRIDASGNMEVQSLIPEDPGQLSQPLDVRTGFRKAGPGSSQTRIKGVHKYVTILVKYSDQVGVTPFTNAYIKNLYGATFPGLDHYFKEGSYGQFSIAGSDVVGWVTLPSPQSSYTSSTTGWGVDWDKITADAIAAVDSQVDFTQYYGLNVIPNVIMGNIGGLGGQRQLTLDGTTRLWGVTYDNPQNNMHALLAHETGHTIGFPHSSGPYGQTYDSLWDIMSAGYFPNGDPTYGTLADATISYNRNIAGWIDPSRMFEGLPGVDKTIRIERLSSPTNSTDYLASKIYINGSGTHYYTVEARRYGGSYEVAASLPQEGILLHDVDENRMVTDPFTGATISGRYAQVVDTDNNGNCNDSGAIWTVGETFTDAAAGITVSVLSADATGYTVHIKVDSSKPFPYELTNTSDSGPGSLRSCLGYARSYPGTKVRFKLSASDPNYAGGVFRIHALTNMPDITADDTTLDGTTQTALTGDTNPNGPEVFLDGAGTSSGITGLWVTGSRFTMKGIAVGNWGGQGVVLDGYSGGHDSVFQGNFFGLSPNGTTAAPNNWPAMTVYRGYVNTTVGGTTIAARNVFAGGTSCGIFFQNAGTSGLVVKGNYFGVTADGTTKLGNGDWNITIRDGAKNVTVGGPESGAGNVISGDTYAGVGVIDPGTANVTIQGNRIGTNAAGTAAIGNQVGAWVANGATNVLIGGSASGEGNLLSGNVFDGIALRGVDGVKVFGNRIGTNPGGTAAVANANWGMSILNSCTNCQIGGVNSGEGNLIAGNTYVGIGIGNAGTSGNLVRGNIIGTNLVGDTALAENFGLYIFDGAANNTVGGSTAAARNVISGHANAGIQVGDLTTTDNLIQGNFIGTRLTGNVGLASPGWGVYVGAKNTTVFGNVISGNMGVGIGVGNGGNGSSIRGNLIGLGADGSTVVANGSAGIQIYGGSPNNTVGGTTAGDRNFVGGNGNTGIVITGSGSDGNKVLGNFVGLSANGNLARPNFYDGIAITNGAKNNFIGGPSTGAGNVIGSSGSFSNNSGAGIACYDAGTSGNVIAGNLIGTSADGTTMLGCGWTGMAASNGAQSNVFGGIAAGAGNRVMGNGSGMYVFGSITTGNPIRGNSIRSNSFLGIDLGANDGSFGVTANDNGDADTGPNNLQNFPVLTSATNLNGSSTVQCTLNSKPSQTYTIDFYSSSAADGSGYGEGESYLGSKSVTTDATGNVSFSATVPHTSGGNLTATATSSAGDTSEFSKVLGTTLSYSLPVSGTVTLQDFAGSMTGLTATVEIRAVGSSTALESKVVSLSSTGGFSFNTALAPGTYDMTVKASHWLRKKSAGVGVTLSGASGLSFALRNGDVNGDNKIDTADQTALTAAFRSLTGQSNWNANADLNGDGQVSASDQAILGKGYGSLGD